MLYSTADDTTANHCFRIYEELKEMKKKKRWVKVEERRKSDVTIILISLALLLRRLLSELNKFGTLLSIILLNVQCSVRWHAYGIICPLYKLLRN